MASIYIKDLPTIVNPDLQNGYTIYDDTITTYKTLADEFGGGTGTTNDGDYLPLTGGTLTGNVIVDNSYFDFFGSGAIHSKMSIDNTDNSFFIETSTIKVSGNILPQTTTTSNLGSASKSWNNGYFNGEIIGVSDERLKTSIRPFNINEINASKQLIKEIGFYKFLSAINEKGYNNAREHTGMTVQKAIEIMENNNLNPFNYGFICYDNMIPEENSGLKNNGLNDKYSFRYTELLAFMLKGIQEQIDLLFNK